MNLTLIIGNQNYSSWSLRAWLAMAKSGMAFKLHSICLDTPEFYETIYSLSPSGCVPALQIDAELTAASENGAKAKPYVVHDSLAICEFAAEHATQNALWPSDKFERASARAISCEMHSGFEALRGQMPMNCRAEDRKIEPSEQTQRDIGRILEIWEQTLSAPKQNDGDWLYGRFSIADAMYAPVVARFRTYGVAVPARSARYMDHVLMDPHMQEWYQAARDETDVLEREETGA